ncbi:putative reverse transcriptase domain-containing protein [Tanacetum coccineum]
METVFHISNCPERYQVKYATCTLLDSALTWWNSHKRTIRTDVAYALSWRELLKLMTEVYCPRNEIQKMETELWNLSVKNNDMATYTQRFQELTMMCTKMVPLRRRSGEKFIEFFPDNIQGNDLESVQYDVSNGLDTAYWVFLRVGTTLDIFQNIHILYLQYSVLVFTGYGVLIMFPSCSLVSAGTDTPYLP